MGEYDDDVDFGNTDEVGDDVVGSVDSKTLQSRKRVQVDDDFAEYHGLKEGEDVFVINAEIGVVVVEQDLEVLSDVKDLLDL